MRTLVIGGTGFLGGAVTEAARAAGHEVFVFTRGRRPLPAGVTALAGDRYGDVGALRGQRFDLVVDTCAYEPAGVHRVLDALAEPERYALISSVSVYSDFSRPGVGEDAPTPMATAAQLALAEELLPEQRTSGAAYGEAYGPLKRAAEAAVAHRLRARALAVRCGLLVGPGDATDRLTYWVRRMDLGGVAAAPAPPERLVQVIDVRDAAGFVVSTQASALHGLVNLTGPPLPLGELLDDCRRVAGADTRIAWVAEEAILAARLRPWVDVPLWLRWSDPVERHFLEISVENALAAGLTLRPLARTIADVLAWDRGRRDVALKAGIPPEVEARLVAEGGC